MGCSLLLDAPSRGKEVMRQLPRLGQIPGMFLKEMGCREKWPRLRMAVSCRSPSPLLGWRGMHA